jgi:hypothetical protein
MKKYIWLLFLLTPYLLATPKPSALPTYEKTFSLLKTLDSEAIVMGTGDKDVYVFVDPLCHFSRKFISKVSKNNLMLKKYKYHIYLYGIPRLHSQEEIDYVYNAKNQLNVLLDIMLNDKKFDYLFTPSPENRQKVQEIKHIAKQLYVNKRPFIIISQEVKK